MWAALGRRRVAELSGAQLANEAAPSHAQPEARPGGSTGVRLFHVTPCCFCLDLSRACSRLKSFGKHWPDSCFKAWHSPWSVMPKCWMINCTSLNHAMVCRMNRLPAVKLDKRGKKDAISCNCDVGAAGWPRFGFHTSR